MAWLAWFVIEDTRQYQSVAQTPWATPLVYPQAVWLACLIVFALVATGVAARATWLLFTGRRAALDREFGPRSTRDELNEELQDIKDRLGGDADDLLAPKAEHKSS